MASGSVMAQRSRPPGCAATATSAQREPSAARQFPRSTIVTSPRPAWVKRKKEWQIQVEKRMESFKREALRTGRPIRDVIDAGVRADFASAGDEPITVICALAGTYEYFADDVRSLCTYCGRAVHHRPFVPKKSTKVCVECARTMPEEID